MNVGLAAERVLAECTVPSMLRDRALQNPDRLMVKCDGIERTAIEQLSVVKKMSSALAAQGVTRGDRVLLMSANRLELLDTILACMWMGAVAVPINTATTTQQLQHILENSGAQIALADNDGVSALQQLGFYADLTQIWSFDANVVGAVEGVNAIPLSDEELEPAPVLPGETAAILYTSGTTGVAKGVTCPHAQFYWWGRNMATQMPLHSDDVLHTMLPLFHTNALNTFFQALISGAVFVIGKKFSASRFWNELTASGATFTYLLGAMVGILMNRPQDEFNAAHTVRAALAPATPADMLFAFQERFNVALIDGFGSTETNSVIAADLNDLRPGYMGKIQPGFEARVIGPDGTILPAGEAGELLLRSSQPYAFATGYFRMPEQTAEAWQDLWFHTGDRVVIEADGAVRFVDRIKDLIRRRGENISSVEVEEAARRHPGVSEAAAYGVASEIGEEEVQISVTVRNGSVLDPAELHAFLSKELPYFAVPRFIVVEQNLPKTANGKISKAPLRARGIVTSAWDKELT